MFEDKPDAYGTAYKTQQLYNNSIPGRVKDTSRVYDPGDDNGSIFEGERGRGFLAISNHLVEHQSSTIELNGTIN